MSQLIEWTINAPAAQHELWRGDAAGQNFDVLATTAPGVSEFEDTINTTPGTYKVRALGEGNPSGFVVVTPEAPAAPNQLTFSNGTVEWVDQSLDETGFQVWRNVNRGAYALLETTAADFQTITDNDGDDGLHSYRVRAFNLGGYSGWADMVAQQPLNLALVGSMGATSRTIEWTLGGGNPAISTQIEIWAQTDGQGYDLLDTVPAGILTYEDTQNLGAFIGLTRDYRLLELNSVGYSASSSVLSGEIVA